jgi:hypothetical protein
MHIAAMLAMQSSCEQRPGTPIPAPMPFSSSHYHGRNVVVRSLSEQGFEADCADDFPVGALVRLRLPGSGVAMARITEARCGSLCAAFINPVGRARLAMTLGVGPSLPDAALA